MSVTVMRTWEKPSMGRDMGGIMPPWRSSSVPNDPTSRRGGSCSPSWTRCSTRSTRGGAANPGRGPHPGGWVAPAGACLVGYEDGRAVAIGGLRGLGGGVCEIKRMYVVPHARSRGVGRALLAALEGAGRRLGYHTVRLAA